MTKADKELLLKDLCARLPYHVIVKMADGAVETLLNVNIDTFICNGLRGLPIPYLRPMSSMTEEEKEEFDTFKFLANTSDNYFSYEMSRFVDWLNQYMFDYRGLIPMGLALEASADMYKKN